MVEDVFHEVIIYFMCSTKVLKKAPLKAKNAAIKILLLFLGRAIPLR